MASVTNLIAERYKCDTSAVLLKNHPVFEFFTVEVDMLGSLPDDISDIPERDILIRGDDVDATLGKLARDPEIAVLCKDDILSLIQIKDIENGNFAF